MISLEDSGRSLSAGQASIRCQRAALTHTARAERLCIWAERLGVALGVGSYLGCVAAAVATLCTSTIVMVVLCPWLMGGGHAFGLILGQWLAGPQLKKAETFRRRARALWAQAAGQR